MIVYHSSVLFLIIPQHILRLYILSKHLFIYFIQITHYLGELCKYAIAGFFGDGSKRQYWDNTGRRSCLILWLPVVYYGFLRIDVYSDVII